MINFLMANASMRKKFNKRSSTKLQEPNSVAASLSSSSPIRSIYKKLFFLVFVAVLIVCGILFWRISTNNGTASRSDVLSERILSIEVVNEFPHDPSAFTQGLLYAGNDTLFESTGLYGHSSVRKVNLQTGKVKALKKMKGSHFGEGLTLLGERLFQVIWLKNIGFIYDRNNLSKIGTFTHQMEDGWGLATDGEVLFGSDGTSTLYHIDPQLLKVTRKQIVKYNGQEVPNLNELEYVNGEVWANVWQTDCIARISPKDGSVLGWILLHKLSEGLLAAGNRGFDVLNGIAWDKDKDRLFVTGKLWPKLYEIKLQQIKTPFNGDVAQMCISKPVHFKKPQET